MLVHLFDGRIEMHFSYFVMVGIVTLYQDWLPLLVVDRLRRAPARHRQRDQPSMVFNHPSGIEHPWQMGRRCTAASSSP